MPISIVFKSTAPSRLYFSYHLDEVQIFHFQRLELVLGSPLELFGSATVVQLPGTRVSNYRLCRAFR